MPDALDAGGTEDLPQDHLEAPKISTDIAEIVGSDASRQPEGAEHWGAEEELRETPGETSSASAHEPLSTFADLTALTVNPTKEDLRGWLASAQRVSARGRDAANATVSLMVLASRWIGGDDYRQLLIEYLAEKELPVPKSRWKYAPVAVAVSLLDVKSTDAQKRKAARQQVDRDAAAAEALEQRIPDEDLESIQRGDASAVNRLNELIESLGGVAKLASTIRASGRRAKREHIIQLDPELHRKAAADRALIELGGTSPDDEPSVILSGVLGTTSGAEKFHFAGDQARRVLAAANLSQPQVALLGEAFLVGQCVEEEETNIPVDRDDDPEDPDTKKRLTRRQYTHLRKGDFLISTILRSSSTIVKIHPHSSLLSRALPGDVKLETKRRIIAEANLLDPERWSAFQLREVDAPETSAPLRLQLLTDAAQKDSDRGRDIGPLLQPHQGQMPLDIAEGLFNPTTVGSITRRAWQRRHHKSISKLALLKKSDRLVMTHKISSSTWDIDVPKRENYEEDVQGKGPTATIQTLAIDFRLASEAIAALPIIGQIEYQIDKQGLMLLAFATSRADYRIFIPMASDTGQRSDRFMRTFEPHPWPHGFAGHEIDVDVVDSDPDSPHHAEDPDI